MMPAASTGIVVRASTARAHINWKSATATKNKPAGIHSCQ